jgi:CheY-like chemotaxis protein
MQGRRSRAIRNSVRRSRASAGLLALRTRANARYKQEVIRVFLLDDHEVVRRGIADLLTTAGDIEIVGESGSAVEATHRIPALRPDVMVLDARLPDGNGIDVCRDVRAIDRRSRA